MLVSRCILSARHASLFAQTKSREVLSVHVVVCALVSECILPVSSDFIVISVENEWFDGQVRHVQSHTNPGAR